MGTSTSRRDPAPRASDELRQLASEVSELLRFEAALGGEGLPALSRIADTEEPAETRTADSPAPGTSTGAPAAVPLDPDLGGQDSVLETARSLVTLAGEAAACNRCGLAAGRTRSVFARGADDADLMFVGEGPGYHEDQQGLPFVGKAGQLLDKMIAAMGYGRDQVYICNVVKCRPPKNRTPLPDEAAACRPFLLGQLQQVQPKVIVALGRCAAEHLNCLEHEESRWRGRWTSFSGIPVMATYHPAFLLRNPAMKRPVWNDLQEVMKRLKP